MGLGKYLKAAFLNHWNLLAFFAGTAFALVSGHPDVVLPLVVAGEVAYLGLLGTHPKFQRAIEAQEAKEKRSHSAMSTEEAFRRIRDALPGQYLARYEALRSRCLELRQIAQDLRPMGRSDSPASLEQMQLAGLDRLLWIFLRLLHTSSSLERFFQRTSEEPIRADIERLESRLTEYSDSGKKRGREKARAAIEDNLQTSRSRLANLEKARENHELIQLEIDRLENKIRTLSEIAVNRQEPEFISDQVDAVASSMMETERTMNELQFATGLTASELVVPELMTRDAGEAEEKVEPISQPTDEEDTVEGRFRRRRRKKEEER